MLTRSIISPDEAIGEFRAVREAYLGFGMILKGSVDLFAREPDGSLAWEHHQDNTITDYGRRFWMEGGFNTAKVILSPCQESPDFRRSLLAGPGDSVSVSESASLTPTKNAATNTKTWSTTFTTPAGTRTIGTIGLSKPNGVNAALGIDQLIAYLLLPSPKTQSTTQTLEVVYKITLISIN